MSFRAVLARVPEVSTSRDNLCVQKSGISTVPEAHIQEWGTWLREAAPEA